MDDDDNVGDGPDDLRPLILVLRYEGLFLMIFCIYICVCVSVHTILMAKSTSLSYMIFNLCFPDLKRQVLMFLTNVVIKITIQNNDDDEDPY